MNTSIAFLAVPVAITIGFVAGRLDTNDLATNSSVLAATAVAQDQEMPPMPPELVPYYQTGDHHKLLEVFVGTWDTTIDVQSPMGAVQGKGTTEGRLVMDGRYLQQNLNAEFPGMPGTFQGMSIMGYDGIGRVFESIWIDNSTTDLMTATGFAAPDGVNFTMLSEELDQTTMKKRELEQRTRVVSRDEIVYEHWIVGADGTQQKTLSVTYKRKAAR